MQFKKQWLELDMEKWTGSKMVKENDKAVYCHSAYLTSMQSTTCKMSVWMNHSLYQDYQEKYQQPQICRWYHSKGRKWRGTKESLSESERGELRSWLKTQHSKNCNHVIQSHNFIANRRGKIGSNDKFSFLGLQITADSYCSHEIKTCLLLWRKAMINLGSF